MAHKILVVGADLGALQDALPMLKRAEFTVVHVARCRDGVAAVRKEHFAVVIVQPPVADPHLRDLVAALRSPGSPNSATELVLIADHGRESEIERLLGHGAARTVPVDEARERLPRVVSELLAATQRQAARVALRLELYMRFATSHTVATTEDISTSGMLVRSSRSFPVGTLLFFELSLTGETKLVRGEARMVRDAGRTRDGLAGLGVKFISFTGDGRQRLAAFLAHQ